MKGQGEKRLYGVLIALLLFALLLTAVLWDRGRFSVPPASGWDGEPSPVPTLNMLLVDTPENHIWLDIPVETGSENTIRWLEVNKGITVVPLNELNGGELVHSPIAAQG